MSPGNYVLCNWKLLTVIFYKSMSSLKQGKTDWCLFKTGHMIYIGVLIMNLVQYILLVTFHGNKTL